MKQNLDSILVINNYFGVCKLKNQNCPKAKIVRLYLCQKISKILNQQQPKPKNWFLSVLF